MSEDIKVKPTPIQRNTNDVAMELLKMHVENKSGDYSIEGLQSVYAKFYSCARMLETTSFKYYKDNFPDELKKIADKF